MRKVYTRQTNFKDVEKQVSNHEKIYLNGVELISHDQILQVDHRKLVALLVQEDITALDEYEAALSTSSTSNDRSDNDTGGATPSSSPFLDDKFDRISLSSICPQCTFDNLEYSHRGDTAFNNFRIHLQNFLSGYLPAFDPDVGLTHRIRFDKEALVCNRSDLELINLISYCIW